MYQLQEITVVASLTPADVSYFCSVYVLRPEGNCAFTLAIHLRHVTFIWLQQKLILDHIEINTISLLRTNLNRRFSGLPLYFSSITRPPCS